jgi:hypothetical protein
MSDERLPPDSATTPEFRLGEGKISGVLAVFLGLLGLGAVLAMRFPGWLTTPEARPVYPLGLIRLLIAVVLLAALASGTISVFLSHRKSRGLLGIALAALATALGGWRVRVDPASPKRLTSPSTGSSSTSSSGPDLCPARTCLRPHP